MFDILYFGLADAKQAHMILALYFSGWQVVCDMVIWWFRAEALGKRGVPFFGLSIAEDTH